MRHLAGTYDSLRPRPFVHGGRLAEKDFRLPRQGGATVGVFRDAVEELMRRGIRKALNEAANVGDFGDSEYWLARLFPT